MISLKIAVLFYTCVASGINGHPFVLELFQDAFEAPVSTLVDEFSKLNPLRLLEPGPSEPCPVVKTNMGSVQGKSEFSRDKSIFFSYLGIPYAKPPVENLRFEPPQPWDEAWETTRDATVYTSACIQFDMVLTGGITGSEDCLYLFVFTRTVDPEQKLPVVIHLHGGMGMEGNSKGYHPKYFMDHNLVFVTLNYRLGALGFLNTGDGTVKGNMGLKDQQLAMNWVQQNIQKFGGDPQKVTLMGDSTGAVSAHFHTLSESSKGLFNRAILQSGHALSPWGFTADPHSQFMLFTQNFDCPDSDISIWVSCMKQKDATEIVEVHSASENPIRSSFEIFTVTVERQEHGAIVTKNPFEILENGNFSHVPIIFGVNKADGAGMTSRIEAHDAIRKTLEISWATYVPIILRYMDNPKISKALKRHYLVPGSAGPEVDLTPIMQMLTDADFLYPLYQVLSYCRKEKSAETYMYYYSYKGQYSIYSALKSYSKDSYIKGKLSVASSFAGELVSKMMGGVAISESWAPVFEDQLWPLFYGTVAAEITNGSIDYDVSKTFVSVLVDFVKESKILKFSDVEWPPVKTEGKIEAMLIDKVSKVTSNSFTDIIPFYGGLHIRDPPIRFSKAVASELQKGDIKPIH